VDFNPRDYMIWLFARLPTANKEIVANLTLAAYAKPLPGATEAKCITRSAA
jgi:hypothetical protein